MKAPHKMTRFGVANLFVFGGLVFISAASAQPVSQAYLECRRLAGTAWEPEIANSKIERDEKIARLYQFDEDQPAAKASCGAALKEDPNNPVVLFRLARTVLNTREANDYLRAAVDLGYGPAFSLLGQQLELGLETNQDIPAAIEFYRRGADLGQPGAQHRLALQYYSGKSVDQNFVTAAALWDKAAHQDFAPALVRLGFLYADGEGVSKDLAQSARLMKKAADFGDCNALSRMGTINEYGIGVVKNQTLAHAYYVSTISCKYVSDSARKSAEEGLAREKTSATKSNDNDSSTLAKWIAGGLAVGAAVAIISKKAQEYETKQAEDEMQARIEKEMGPTLKGLNKEDQIALKPHLDELRGLIRRKLITEDQRKKNAESIAKMQSQRDDLVRRKIELELKCAQRGGC